MSQYQSQFRLDYGKYFDNHPNTVQVPSVTGDQHDILNLSRTVRGDDSPSGLSTNADKAMIPTTKGDIKAAQSIREAATKGNKPDMQIDKSIGGGETGGGTITEGNRNTTGGGITEDLKTVEETGGAISPESFPTTVGKSTDSTAVAGALSFSTKSLPAGALAFNNAALEKLKKGDNIKGAGPVTAAAVSALISAAPSIIAAIKDYRNSTTKGGRYIAKCEGSGIYKMYVKGLSDDKIAELEDLCKKIRGQGRYLSGGGDIGSGKFGTFMSNAWNKLKGLYNSEQFKPIKSALLKAASNTASNAKDQLLNSGNGAGITDESAVGGSQIAADVNSENVDGVRLFEESICYDPIEETVNKVYSTRRLACPRGYLEGAGGCKYRRGRSTRIAF